MEGRAWRAVVIWSRESPTALIAVPALPWNSQYDRRAAARPAPAPQAQRWTIGVDDWPRNQAGRRGGSFDSCLAEMGASLLSGPAARRPARWISRNRCQDSGATSPAARTSPRIAQIAAMTSPAVMPGFTVPAAIARA